MAVLSQRQQGYVGGLVTLCVGTVLFLVGFSTTHWSTYTIASTYVFEFNDGLWVVCWTYLGHSECGPSSSNTVWMTTTKALECMALIGLFMAACYAVGVNFLVAQPQFSRFLEICTACAGSFGVGGAVIYVFKASQLVNAVNSLVGSGASIDNFTVHWSFGVTIGGAALILFATFLIATNNEPLPHEAGAGTSVLFTTGNTPNGGAAHVLYPGSNPYSVSVVQHQSGGFYPSAPPAYYQAGVPPQGQMYGQGQAPGPAVAFNSDGP